MPNKNNPIAVDINVFEIILGMGMGVVFFILIMVDHNESPQGEHTAYLRVRDTQKDYLYYVSCSSAMIYTH